VFRQVNTLPDRLHPPVWAVMQAGSLGAVGAAAAAAWAARRHATAVGLGATGFTMWAGAKVVKRGVRRGRPRAHVPSVNIRGAEARGLGFPSGHAAVSFALATVAAPALPRAARPVPWAVALAASTARMYVGAHLPLDVLGGAALGVAAGALTNVAIGDRTPHG
jgi:membrane-associated phospholipid phosphatase